MYKFRNNLGKRKFSDQFSKVDICYKEKGYNTGAIKQPACLAVVQITVDHFAYPFNNTPVGRTLLYDGPDLKTIYLDGLCLFLGQPGINWWSSFAPVF